MIELAEALKFIAFTSLGFSVGWWQCRRVLRPQYQKYIQTALDLSETYRKQLEDER